MHVNPYSTLERQWAMLRAIPHWPQTSTTTALTRTINEEGFRATRRTVERDLKEISRRFPITADESGKTFRWGWMKSAAVDFLPRLTVPQCLALTLVQQHARHLMPKTMLDDLAPLFDAAERALAKTPWKDWHKRTAVVPPAFVLQPPKIKAKALSAAQHALAHRLCLTTTYRSKGNKTATARVLHPLGLLVRGSVQYLVCMQGDSNDPRQFAIHRMRHTVATTAPCRNLHGFSMKRYAARNLAINSHGSIRLHAHVLASASEHLLETPMSKYQTSHPIEGTDKVEICATVEDDLQLKRYLLSFGSELEVLEPARLRNEILDDLGKMLSAYQAR